MKRVKQVGKATAEINNLIFGTVEEDGNEWALAQDSTIYLNGQPVEDRSSVILPAGMYDLMIAKTAAS